MARKERTGGGGKLNRSETVTIRLDPKLNYLAELAARSQRRTKSSLIEASLAQALNGIPVETRPSLTDQTTIAQIADLVWHVDEHERLIRLAIHAPHLMTFEEQKIWAVITKNGSFWLGMWRDLNADTEYYSFNPQPQNIYPAAVELHWDLIKRVAAGEASADKLPQGANMRQKDSGGALVGLEALPSR